MITIVSSKNLWNDEFAKYWKLFAKLRKGLLPCFQVLTVSNRNVWCVDDISQPRIYCFFWNFGGCCEIPCYKVQNFQTRQQTNFFEMNAKSAVLSNHQNFSVLISRPTNQSSFDSFEFWLMNHVTGKFEFIGSKMRQTENFETNAKSAVIINHQISSVPQNFSD